MATRKDGLGIRIDFEAWELASGEWWKVNGYSDAMSVAEESEFHRDGCECCAHVARLNGQTPKAGDVYKCEDVNGNEFYLCGNCVCSAVNGDNSWFDYYADGDGFISI